MARTCALTAIALIAWLTLVGGTWLIAESSLQYLAAGSEHPFLTEHPEVAGSLLWRGMLSIHMLGGVVLLASSFLQFFRPVLRRFPWLHRWLGRVYMSSALFIVVPTGLYLAPYATGGLAGKLGFALLGILLGVTTAIAWWKVRRGDIRAHIAWSCRSMALATSAITFRLLFLILRDAAPDPLLGFNLSLYLSTFGNLAIAELILAALFFRRVGENLPGMARPQTL